MAFSFGAPAKPATTTGGFSFGGGANTTTTPQPAASTSGGGGSSGGFSFGQPQQQQQQQQQPASSTGGFSFGQPQQQQQQQQQQQPASGGFSFGQSQPSQPSQPSSTGGFSFGQQKPAGSGFSFGGSTTQQQQQQPQQQQQQNPLGVSQFGQSQLGQPQSQLGQSQSQPPQQQQQQQQDKRLGASLAPKLEAVRQAWDSNNLQTCRFMTYFYNNIPPGTLPPAGPSGAGGPFDANPNFGRRQDAVGPIHDALWQKAVAENPDPTHLVPVLAVGFQDLKQRVESQQSETQRQTSHVKTINDRITALEQKHTLSDSVRASAALKRQAALHHRLIRITRKSHLLLPSLRGSPISREEEALRAKLEQCEAELESGSAAAAIDDDAAGGVGGGGLSAGRLRSRVNELWALLGSVKAKRELLERSGRKPGTEWAVVDESGVEEVVNILAQQQQGLNHLIQTLEEDSKALDVVLQGLKGVQLVGVRGGGAR